MTSSVSPDRTEGEHCCEAATLLQARNGHRSFGVCSLCSFRSHGGTEHQHTERKPNSNPATHEANKSLILHESYAANSDAEEEEVARFRAL